MNKKIRLIMAQLNFLVGDIEGNAEKIIAQSIIARDQLKADIIVFPELCLAGYPPEDLLFRSELYARIHLALNKIREAVHHIYLVIGYPEKTTQGIYNCASLLYQGEIVTTHYKQYLPNYSVFDEKRYFVSGANPTVATIHGVPIAISICEDLWFCEPMLQATQAGAKLMISINASPFDMNKPLMRQEIMAQRAKEGKIPVIYTNLVGGQDELVFDGGSMAIDQEGNTQARADFFKEVLFPVDLQYDDDQIKILNKQKIITPAVEALIYQALVVGVHDYIKKNHFPGVIIGLSGGIDSALTLAIAVDALGSHYVETIMMPSAFTSELSLQGALQQANTQKVAHHIISIEEIYHAFLTQLQPLFGNLPQDTTEQNIQARIRGILLMALSNKKGKIILATGNKSEISVGYSTLYGDMVGGFCPLKDIYKTMVYRLAKYRNQISPVIPEQVIERAPSAELASNQKDEDDLPPYRILDEILERYIERDQSLFEIVSAGFDENTVRRVIQMITHNEYKRRQAAPGVKITSRAFGRDRRYPITSGFASL